MLVCAGAEGDTYNAFLNSCMPNTRRVEQPHHTNGAVRADPRDPSGSGSEQFLLSSWHARHGTFLCSHAKVQTIIPSAFAHISACVPGQKITITGIRPNTISLRTTSGFIAPRIRALGILHMAVGQKDLCMTRRFRFPIPCTPNELGRGSSFHWRCRVDPKSSSCVLAVLHGSS